MLRVCDQALGEFQQKVRFTRSRVGENEQTAARGMFEDVFYRPLDRSLSIPAGLEPGVNAQLGLDGAGGFSQSEVNANRLS